MAKKYALLKRKQPNPEGGFWESIVVGIVDLNCWGDQYYDAAGYPFADAAESFALDWAMLGADYESAAGKILNADPGLEKQSNGTGSEPGTAVLERTKK